MMARTHSTKRFERDVMRQFRVREKSGQPDEHTLFLMETSYYAGLASLLHELGLSRVDFAAEITNLKTADEVLEVYYRTLDRVLSDSLSSVGEDFRTLAKWNTRR